MFHITTIILAIYSFIYLLVSMIMLFVRKPVPGTYGLGTLFIIFSIISLSIMTVDNECIITGPCLIWGWIRFALVCLFIILPSFITTIIALGSRNKEEQ